MSNGFWNQEEDDFRDNPVELKDGKWEHVPTVTPPAVPNQRQNAVKSSESISNNIAHDISVNIQIEEEDDYSDVLSDARLRLEQGKLYEMIMNHDLFNGLDADPKAVKNVQKEIRRFAKERMEIMLGMRVEKQDAIPTIIPFNDLEIEILKKLAYKATNGATEAPEANKYASSLKEPKKQTLNTIGGSTNPKKMTPVVKQALPQKPSSPIKRPQVSETNDIDDYRPLEKPIHEMTAEELIERNKQAQERQMNKKAAMPSNRMPPASYEQTEFLAQQQALMAGSSPAVSRLVDTINVLTAASKMKQ